MKFGKEFWHWCNVAFMTVLVGLSMIFFGCTKKGNNEINIGVILPLTGDGAFYGESIKKGIDFGAAQINLQDGLNGRKINLIYEDSKGLPTEGVNAFQRLISTKKLNVVIGDAVSSVTLAIAPIAEKRRIVIMSPLSSAPALSEAGDYIFRNVPSDFMNGKAAANFLVKIKSWKRLAVLYVNNDFGVGLNSIFKSEVERLGGQIVAAESYNPGSSDFRTELSKIVFSNPEAVFLIGYSELSQTLIQAKEMNIKASLIGTGLLEDPNLLKVAKDAAEGVMFTQLQYDPASTDTVTKIFVEQYETKYGDSPNIMAAYGYDALKVLAFAISGSDFSSDSIKNRLYSVRNFPGVTGDITFDKNGDVIQPMGVKIIESGNFVWILREIPVN